MAWLAAGAAGSFLVPFVLADQLGLQRDLYYALYILFVLALCAGWMHDTGQSMRALVTRRWRLALVLAAIFSIVAVFMVLGAEAPASHPGGVEFIAALLWRGLAYGLADGLLLTAFPILLVFAAYAARSGGQARTRATTVRIGALALLASLAMTGIYHLGYEDFRGDKVTRPMAGDLIWSPATLLTLNPVGAPIVHGTMHITAVAHSYDTDLFLPPH
jgi:hypothetical protein